MRMQSRNRACDPKLHTRRGALRVGFDALASMSVLGSMLRGSEGVAQAQEVDRGRRATSNVILVMLHGGLSQLDSLDPKPHLPSEIRGPFRARPTKSGKALITDPFAALGTVDDEYALLRGMDAQNNGGHPDAMRLWMRSGGLPTDTHLFSLITRGVQGRLPGADFVLPGVEDRTTSIPESRQQNILGSGASLLEMRWDEGRKDCVCTTSFEKPPGHEGRMDLRSALDTRGPGGAAAERFLDNMHVADRVVRDGLTNAFEDKNPRVREARRAAYGDDAYGRMFSIAGALADPQRGNAQMVVLETGHWDDHEKLEAEMGRRGPQLARSLAALIHEMHDKVVIAVRGEFGRYGRDYGNCLFGLPGYSTFGRLHYPVHSGLIAGPNVKTGPYGETSRDGQRIASGRITNGDFQQLILQAAGLTPRTFENQAVTALIKV
jgi:Protein of unknown function (DUF1501)